MPFEVTLTRDFPGSRTSFVSNYKGTVTHFYRKYGFDFGEIFGFSIFENVDTKMFSSELDTHSVCKLSTSVQSSLSVECYC